MTANPPVAEEPPSHLASLLLPSGACPQIGPETESAVGPGILLRFQSTRTFRPRSPRLGGSYRFVRVEDGATVAALQVMSPTGRGGVIANVYCAPGSRRQGHASALLEAARGVLGTISHADDLSPDGKAWAAAVEKSTNEKSGLRSPLAGP